MSALDQVEADLARRLTYRLQVIARLDEIGDAEMGSPVLDSSSGRL